MKKKRVMRTAKIGVVRARKKQLIEASAGRFSFPRRKNRTARGGGEKKSSAKLPELFRLITPGTHHGQMVPGRVNHREVRGVESLINVLFQRPRVYGARTPPAAGLMQRRTSVYDLASLYVWIRVETRYGFRWEFIWIEKFCLYRNWRLRRVYIWLILTPCCSKFWWKWG